MERAKETNQDLDVPKVEFIISRGKEEQVFFNNGSVEQRLGDRKIDPNCKNSVRTSSGSEQGFDSVGLCKVRGNVHWGKSSQDGVMEITLGTNTKIKLDSKWQLLSVKSENTDYDKQRDEARLAQAKEQSILAHKPSFDHVGWKPLHPYKPEPVSPKQASESASERSKKAEAALSGKWKTTVTIESGTKSSTAGKNRTRELAAPLDIRPAQYR